VLEDEEIEDEEMEVDPGYEKIMRKGIKRRIALRIVFINRMLMKY